MFQKTSLMMVLSFLLLFAFSQSQARTVLELVVKEDRINCTGVGSQSCLQVQYKNTKNWTTFYESIKGFNYEEGYRYTLLVYRTKRSAVPADASMYAYSLKKIVKKQKRAATKVAKAKETDATAIWGFVSGKTWKLIQLHGVNRANTKAMIRFDKESGRVNGNGGCNGFFGGFTTSGDRVTFKEMASTMMACLDENVSQLEFAFLGALRNQTFTFDVADQTLQLYHGDSLVMIFALDATASSGKADKEANLQGTIYWKEGNHMPSPGGKSAGTSRPVSREVIFYETTNMRQVVPATEAGFYKTIRSKKIKSVWSDNSGKYKVALPSGTYSVFIKENGLFYANRGDGNGNLNTVTIGDGVPKDFDMWIDYKATY